VFFDGLMDLLVVSV